MPSSPDAARFVGSLLGYVFLLCALVSALCGVFVLILLAGNAAIPGLVVGVPLFFGVTSLCLFLGITIRKAVAGTVLPFDINIGK